MMVRQSLTSMSSTEGSRFGPMAPFGFLCLTLVITWYALSGHAPDDITERRRRSPWYGRGGGAYRPL
jgi:hypothetical protein